MQNYCKKLLKMSPGIALSLAIALVAVFMEGLIEKLIHTHVIGAAVIAMFIGMILNSLIK